jgi:hypothetical protein
MSAIMKIRLLTMLDNEIRHVNGMISNESLWALGSSSKEDSQMHSDNMSDLEEYKSLLLKMRDKVEREEDFNA